MKSERLGRSSNACTPLHYLPFAATSAKAAAMDAFFEIASRGMSQATSSEPPRAQRKRVIP